MSSKRMSRRKFLQLSALAGAGIGAALAGGLPALAQDATATVEPTPELPPTPAPGPIDLEAAGGMDALIAAAKAEGQLSTIALPDDWANYGQMKHDFFAKYDFLTLNDLNPDGSSGQEIEAIQSNAGNSGPQNPDVVDVGFVWGDPSKPLFQPYKVATWDTIPDSQKDKDGYWYGDYYGTLAFEVNSDIVKNVPQDWSDLLKPEYNGMIALGGDPTSANQAIYAVWAAALANGGSLDDAQPGLDFFKKLAQAGNFVPVVALPATIAKGDTPITIRWDYNSLANRDNSATTGGPTITVVYPKSGSIAGEYIQAISAYAPRPNAARLWMEYLYSDAGQLTWLAGYAKPARYDDLVAKKLIPDDLMKKLPSVDVPVAFPTADQINKAIDQIKTGWPTTVGVAVANPSS